MIYRRTPVCRCRYVHSSFYFPVSATAKCEASRRLLHAWARFSLHCIQACPTSLAIHRSETEPNSVSSPAQSHDPTHRGIYHTHCAQASQYIKPSRLFDYSVSEASGSKRGVPFRSPTDFVGSRSEISPTTRSDRLEVACFLRISKTILWSRPKKLFTVLTTHRLCTFFRASHLRPWQTKVS